MLRRTLPVFVLAAALLAAPGMAAVAPGAPAAAPRAAVTVLSLRLRPGMPTPAGIPPTAQSEVYVTLGQPGALPGLDPNDAFALAPPAPAYVLASTEATDGATSYRFAIDARPVPTVTLTIPLHFAGVVGTTPVAGAYTVDWSAPTDLPAGWTVGLVDAETGTTSSLNAAGSYSFVLAVPEVPRFTLVITPLVTDGEGGPPAVAVLALSAPRPNPTGGVTFLDLALPAAADVVVTVYDALGRHVAMLAEGPRAAGLHALRFDARALAVGPYVVRADVTTPGAPPRRLTRRLTVVR